jgi:hypothetical protein
MRTVSATVTRPMTTWTTEMISARGNRSATTPPSGLTTMPAVMLASSTIAIPDAPPPVPSTVKASAPVAIVVPAALI